MYGTWLLIFEVWMHCLQLDRFALFDTLDAVE